MLPRMLQFLSKKRRCTRALPRASWHRFVPREQEKTELKCTTTHDGDVLFERTCGRKTALLGGQHLVRKRGVPRKGKKKSARREQGGEKQAHRSRPSPSPRSRHPISRPRFLLLALSPICAQKPELASSIWLSLSLPFSPPARHSGAEANGYGFIHFLAVGCREPAWNGERRGPLGCVCGTDDGSRAPTHPHPFMKGGEAGGAMTWLSVKGFVPWDCRRDFIIENLASQVGGS